MKVSMQRLVAEPSTDSMQYTQCQNRAIFGLDLVLVVRIILVYHELLNEHANYQLQDDKARHEDKGCKKERSDDVVDLPSNGAGRLTRVVASRMRSVVSQRVLRHLRTQTLRTRLCLQLLNTLWSRRR